MKPGGKLGGSRCDSVMRLRDEVSDEVGITNCEGCVVVAVR
jgi:hypothetical protein